MPLSTGTSNKAREQNVKTEIAAGKKPDEAVAISYSKQRENIAKKSGDDLKTDLIKDIRADITVLIKLLNT